MSCSCGIQGEPRCGRRRSLNGQRCIRWIDLNADTATTSGQSGHERRSGAAERIENHIVCVGEVPDELHHERHRLWGWVGWTRCTHGGTVPPNASRAALVPALLSGAVHDSKRVDGLTWAVARDLRGWVDSIPDSTAHICRAGAVSVLPEYFT